MEADKERILEQFGWVVECESPFELRNGESFARHAAADIVWEFVKEQYEYENRKKKKPKTYKLLVEGEECKQVHLQDHIDSLGFSFYPIEVIEIRKKYLLGFEKSINKVHKLKSFFVLLNGKMVNKTIKDFTS